MRSKVLLTAALGLALTGCASFVSRTSYPVTVTSSPLGEAVQIFDEDGEFVSEGVTPFVVTLSASAGWFDAASYTLKTETGGVAELAADLDEWYLANIPALSLSGLLLIDPGSGAMWELDEAIHVVTPAEAATR